MTIHRYRLTVELTSPAALAAGRERGFVTPAHDDAPGSVVRGCSLPRWIAVHGRPEDDPDAFDAHVVGLRVGPALPSSDARRVPLSVYQCKYPTTATCRSTAVDAAFDQVTSCPGLCGAPPEPSRGQWTASPRVVRRSSTALDADETAAEQAAVRARRARGPTDLQRTGVGRSALARRGSDTAACGGPTQRARRRGPDRRAVAAAADPPRPSLDRRSWCWTPPPSSSTSAVALASSRSVATSSVRCVVRTASSSRPA